MHGTIFQRRGWNAAGGNIMLWLNGGCYSTFDELSRLHIAHHVDRVDFCRFDLQAFKNGNVSRRTQMKQVAISLADEIARHVAGRDGLHESGRVGESPGYF